jgi:ABC-type Fe3+-siderophore transport system permease subunit
VPAVQAIHICAIAVVVASAMIGELRLVGMIAADETSATVLKRYLPWMWRALVVLLLSGIILVWGEPERTLFSWVFWLKMGLVLIGFVLSVLFRKPLLDPEFNARRAARAWSIRPVAWLSLSIWIAVVCSGRWIAYAG